MLVVVGKSKIGLKRFLELLSTQRALPEIVRAVCFSAPTMMQCSVLVDALDDSQIHGNRLELRVAIMFIPEKKRSIRLWYYWNSTLKKLRSWHPVPSVQFSCVRLFVTPWTAAHQASLSITKFQSLLKLISIESVLLYNHLILCHPLLLLPSIFPSIKVFSDESVLCIRWPNYWSFGFNISPSNQYAGLISFRMDWFDLLAVQGTLKSPLQHHSSKSSVLWWSAFFIFQLSHPFMTTGNAIALTR